MIQWQKGMFIDGIRGFQLAARPDRPERLGGMVSLMTFLQRNKLEKPYFVRYNVQKRDGGTVCKDYELTRISGQ
jgi:hypothetical protein